MVDSAFNAYLEWIKTNGGSFQKINFRKDLHGEGCVYTTDTVKENEQFATVPFKICITEKVARKALPTLTDFSGRVVQSLFLLLQKNLGERSFYYPYINILPKRIVTAMHFDEEDMAYLQKTNMELAVRERKAALQSEFTRLLEHLPENVHKEDVRWEDFLWAHSMYSSRAFPYKLIDPSSTEESEVLFPLVDALNHKPNTKITWSRSGNSETGSLTFVAGQEYQVGDEIFNNYGPKSNEELLIGYGFCFEYNEYDHIALKPNFSQDLNYQVKLNILQNCGISSGNADPYTFYIHRNNVPPMFFKMMRVLVMNNMETAYYRSCHDPKFLDMVGYRNELSMLSMTLTLLKTRLIALKSVNLDTSDYIPAWRKFALMYRAGQEDVYNVTIAKVEEMKSRIISCMNQDIKENRMAPNVPFLSIVNPDYDYTSLTIDSSPFVSLDMVVITLDSLLRKNDPFSTAITEIFEDFDEEADVIFMLSLINEKFNENSKWKEFFKMISSSDTTVSQDEQELREMYDSMIPEFAEAYPHVFSLDKFSFESFVWADNILNNYSIDNPLAIVPL